MACNFAQNKGKRGERLAVKALQPVIDGCYENTHLEAPQLFRNGNQAAGGGYDIDGISWLALEIKNCETLQIPKWWRQAVRQACGNQVPVLMYKQSRKPWRICIWGYIPAGPLRVRTMVDIPFVAFVTWFEAMIKQEIKAIEEG